MAGRASLLYHRIRHPYIILKKIFCRATVFDIFLMECHFSLIARRPGFLYNVCEVGKV